MMTRLQLNYQTLDANSSWARDWDQDQHQDSLVSSTSGDSHVLAYFSGINVNRAGTAVRPQYGPQSAQTANGNGFLIECTIKCEMHFTAQKQTTSKEEKNEGTHSHTHTHINLLQIANSKWSLAPVLKRTRSYIAYISHIYILYLFPFAVVRNCCNWNETGCAALLQIEQRTRAFVFHPCPLPVVNLPRTTPARRWTPLNLFNLRRKLRFICFGQHIDAVDSWKSIYFIIKCIGFWIATPIPLAPLLLLLFFMAHIWRNLLASWLTNCEHNVEKL